MFIYQVIGTIAAFAVATLVDWFVWHGQHWAVILALFAVPSFEWVSRAFIAFCTDQPRDPDEERLVSALDQRSVRFSGWWRRQLAGARLWLRGQFGVPFETPR